MKKKHALLTMKSLLILWASASVLLSCEGTQGPGPMPENSSFEQVVNLGQTIVNPTTFENVDSTNSVDEQEFFEDEIWICSEFEVDLSQNAEDFVLYASNNAEIIYPGNFLQGKSVFEGAPRIIPLKRGPGTITINTLNGSSIVTENVGEVSFSKIAQATNDLIGNNNGTLTANISYEREEVRSLQEVGVKMNAEFSTLATEVKGSFDYNSSFNFNSIFVKVTQSLYSIVLDIPDIENAFDPSVTPDDLAKYVSEDNPATYISSVNYGRIFYLLIQSTQSSSDIKAAVEGSFNGAVVSGSGSVDVSVVNELDNVRISGYAYGGDANLAAGALVGSMEDVKTFIEEGGAINNGAPISYVVRSLEDPSIVVKANLATKYTVTECENVSGGIPVFTDARQSVGAAASAGAPGTLTYPMYLIDKISNEYVGVSRSGGVVGPFDLWQWGPDNTNPFRNDGIGAALNMRAWNPTNQMIFFDKLGTRYTGWKPDGTFTGPFPLSQWGPPFSAIGAGLDASIGNREIACLFNLEGTEYTLYESGTFSSPRPISDFQIKSREAALEIPFSAVGACMRLVLNSDRNVAAIFNLEGDKYVYYDMDRNVIVGPLDL
ncbi:MAG: thiol-activated cytolysin family protein [Bacteroidia bacterium]|nr:thiol-activated cytolysin family protein [Bacteroidia bacterium]